MAQSNGSKNELEAAVIFLRRLHWLIKGIGVLSFDLTTDTSKQRTALIKAVPSVILNPPINCLHDVSALVKLGCNQQLVLSCCRILAEPIKKGHYSRSTRSFKSDLQIIREAKTTLEHWLSILDYSFISNDASTWNYTHAELLQLPMMIDFFAGQFERWYREQNKLSREHQFRNWVLFLIGEHILTHSRFHRWEKIANIMNQYSADSPSAETLLKQFTRIRPKF